MKLLIGIVLLAAAGVLLLRHLERRLIFYPMTVLAASPRDAGLPFEEAALETSDGLSLHAWLIPRDGASHTVLFCHGNAGNISHRIEKAAILRGLGLQVFLFDYRGYGRSQGRPDEAGLYRDTLAAYEHLVARGIPPDRIIAYGESIGGVFAADLAARRPVRAVITENTFTSIPDMARNAFGFFPAFLLPSRMDTLSKMREAKADKLIIHTPGDEIVPYAFGRKLYDEAAPPKRFLEIRGGHNTAYIESRELYERGISEFLASLAAPAVQ